MCGRSNISRRLNNARGSASGFALRLTDKPAQQRRGSASGFALRLTKDDGVAMPRRPRALRPAWVGLRRSAEHLAGLAPPSQSPQGGRRHGPLRPFACVSSRRLRPGGARVNADSESASAERQVRIALANLTAGTARRRAASPGGRAMRRATRRSSRTLPRAIATARLSLPWRYALAVAESMRRSSLAGSPESPNDQRR